MITLRPLEHRTGKIQNFAISKFPPVSPFTRKTIPPMARSPTAVSKKSNFFETVFCSFANSRRREAKSSIDVGPATNVRSRSSAQTITKGWSLVGSRRPSNRRANDCLDVAVLRCEASAMRGAMTENRRLQVLPVDSWGGLPWDWLTSTELPKVGDPRRPWLRLAHAKLLWVSRKRCISRDALNPSLTPGQ